MAFHTASAVMGSRSISTSNGASASQSALATAAAGGMVPLSPMPRMPNGVTGERVSGVIELEGGQVGGGRHEVVDHRAVHELAASRGRRPAPRTAPRRGPARCRRGVWPSTIIGFTWCRSRGRTRSARASNRPSADRPRRARPRCRSRRRSGRVVVRRGLEPRVSPGGQAMPEDGRDGDLGERDATSGSSRRRTVPRHLERVGGHLEQVRGDAQRLLADLAPRPLSIAPAPAISVRLANPPVLYGVLACRPRGRDGAGRRPSHGGADLGEGRLRRLADRRHAGVERRRRPSGPSARSRSRGPRTPPRACPRNADARVAGHLHVAGEPDAGEAALARAAPPAASRTPVVVDPLSARSRHAAVVAAVVDAAGGIVPRQFVGPRASCGAASRPGRARACAPGGRASTSRTKLDSGWP